MRSRLVACSVCVLALALASPTPAQTIVTVAGGGNGDGLPATVVALPSPTAVVTDSRGDLLIADSEACLVWRLDQSSRRLRIVAGTGRCGSNGDGGPARRAELNRPSGLVINRREHLFISEAGGHRIREVDLRTGVIETVAGNGTQGFGGDGGDARDASLDTPLGLALDAEGRLYVADSNNNRIRRVRGGHIDTVLGPHVRGLSDDLSGPSAVILDGQGRLYVADTDNHRVLVWNASSGRTRVIAKGGDDTYWNFDEPPPLESAMEAPAALGLGANGDLYIVDAERSCVWLLDARGRLRVAVGYRSSARNDPQHGGDGGPGFDSQLDRPQGIALATNGDLYIADAGNARIRRVTAKTGNINTIAGNGTSSLTGDGEVATAAALAAPAAVAVDRAGALYIADSGNGSVRKMDPVDGTILEVVGARTDRWGGFGHSGLSSTRAGLELPAGVAVDPLGNVYVSDSGGGRIRRFDASSALVTTMVGGKRFSDGFGGDGGPARLARMHGPHGLAITPDGSLYVADLYNGRVRRIDRSTGVISSVASAGPDEDLRRVSPDGRTTTYFGSFNAVAVDAAGNLYIADMLEHRIHRVAAQTGVITTFAGNGTGDSEGRGTLSGDGGPAVLAGLNGPRGVAVDAANNVYVADTGNHRVRRIDARTGIISTVAGTGAAGFSGDGGPASDAQLNRPSALAVAADGTLYIADSENNRVRAVLFNPNPATLFLGHVAGRTAAPGESGAYAAAARTCDLLTRHLPALNLEGDLRLWFHKAEYVSAALVELQAPDAVRQIRAARCLRILLSPWARTEIEGERDARFTEIRRIRRPPERPVLDPAAPVVRRGALALLADLVQQPLTPVDRDNDVFSATLVLLAEVGNDDTARALHSFIGPRVEDIRADAIMNTIARMHGFPQTWGGEVLIDDLGGPEAAARFAAEQAVKRKARVVAFRAWHTRVLRSSQPARLRAALRQWESSLQWGSSSASRFEDELAGVIRLGEPAVPLLRKLAEETPDNGVRAGAYIAIAAITGQVDADMVAQLLDGDTEEVVIGAAMIEGAGSRAWRDKLIDVLNRRDASFAAAAKALATCHLRDALAPLQAFRGDKSLSHYALMELEAGLQHGEW